jgi:hypothetical protein
MRWLLSLGLCALLAVPVALGDGLVHALPADGTSAKFAIELNMKKGNEEKKAEGSLVMSSVGVTDVDGKKCRWIEFKMHFTIDDKEQTIVAKALVLEKALKEGENPGAAMIRGWLKDREDQEPKELKDLQDDRAGPLPVFLSGPLQNAKKLDKKTLENKALGKIDCAGIQGENSYDLKREKLEVKMENRLHPKAPFGVVESKMHFQAFRDGQARDQGTLILRLVEVGKDAKSELPDQK